MTHPEARSRCSLCGRDVPEEPDHAAPPDAEAEGRQGGAPYADVQALPQAAPRHLQQQGPGPDVLDDRVVAGGPAAPAVPGVDPQAEARPELPDDRRQRRGAAGGEFEESGFAGGCVRADASPTTGSVNRSVPSLLADVATRRLPAGASRTPKRKMTSPHQRLTLIPSEARKSLVRNQAVNGQHGPQQGEHHAHRQPHVQFCYVTHLNPFRLGTVARHQKRASRVRGRAHALTRR